MITYAKLIMKTALNILVILTVIVFFCSCADVDSDPVYHYTEYYYIINDSSHQIYMSDIVDYLYPDSINLAPADSGNTNIWSLVNEDSDVVYGGHIPQAMNISVDDSCSYAIYYVPGSSTCKCKSSVCKCGRYTAGEYDVKCMCGADVINPCESSNWFLASVNGKEPDNGLNDLKESPKKGERVMNTVVWTYTITEEMVEQTLSLLAEE